MSEVDSNLEKAVTDLNYHHAAFTYLDEYLWIDKRLGDQLNLCLEDPEEAVDSKTKGIAAIAEFLTRYSVARNFKTVGEQVRYEAVWNALRNATRPTEDNIVTAVQTTCEELQKTYSNAPWSATTKLLWLRFHSPVIIYDLLAWNWLHKHGSLRDSGGYGGFVQEWRKAYGYASAQAADASRDLLNVRRFTRAPLIPEDKLKQLIQAPWFHERVFDHAMVNEQSERELTASLQ